MHSISSGYINAIASSRKGIANGLYISFYYAGGTVGTFLPGFLFESAGWHWFLNLLTLIATISAGLLFSLRQSEKRLS